MCVLSQKTRLWFRVGVFMWGIVVLISPFTLYDEIFNSHTTRFTCDRASGICAIEGSPQPLPRLPNIVRAAMDHDFNRRDGANWGINLVTSDGNKFPIERNRAIKDSVIADYRRAAKQINAFLSDPKQQKLDASFTYRAGLTEILVSIFNLVFGVVTLWLGSLLWRRSTYTFESGKVTLSLRGPFLRREEEISNNRITAILNRPLLPGRRLELKLADTSSLPVLDEAANEKPVIGALAIELAALMGKPLETVQS
jgi:hypothetical protein